MAAEEEELGHAELANLIDSLIAAWREVGAQAGKGARPGSRAALDAAEILRDLPAGVDRVEYAAGQMAGRMVDAIALLLQSVGTQLRADPVVSLAVWPLVRAELEHAGRVAWLLEALDGAGAAGVRRAARALLEHASALQRDKYTASKWPGALTKDIKRRRDELLRQIRGMFSDVNAPLDTPEMIGEWRIGGEEMAGLGKATKLFVALNFGTGHGVYDFLSDRSHPSVTSLAWQSVAEESDGVTTWSYPATAAVLNYQVSLGCLILYRAAHTVAGYHGLDAAAIERWSHSAPAHWFVEGPGEDS